MPSQPMRPPRGRVPFLIPSGRVAALDSGFQRARAGVRSNRRASPRGRRVVRVPPYPPRVETGRAKARAERERGRADRFFRRERARSARESWFSGPSARKSLIVEKSTAMYRPLFATSRGIFATSPIFAPAVAAPFSLLSNSLKKKKKESKEEAIKGRNRAPRVLCFLPRVFTSAYFLSHEFSRPSTGNSWQLMALNTLKNHVVTLKTSANHESTSCAACGSFL